MSEDNLASPTAQTTTTVIDQSKIVDDVTSKVSESYDAKLRAIEEDVSQKTTKLAEKEVSRLKEDLINNLAGKKEPKYEWEKKGRKDPESWNQVMSEAEKVADEKFEKKMEAWQRKQQEENQKVQSKRIQETNERRNKFSREWYDLVEKGKMPAPNPQIMERLKRGEKVSETEARKDKGLQEYRRLIKSALDNNDDNLKVTYYERYSQEPVGMEAPVFGSDNVFGGINKEDEFSYEEIQGMGKKKWY